jgi:predicted RNA-binding Zn-ribbon protein involved in translation (DUF1610 family)
LNKIIKEYRIELLALCIAILGIFLIIAEKSQIRKIIFGVLSLLNALVKNLFQVVIPGITNYFSVFSLTDIVGWILILCTTAFVIWRIRYRYSTAERFRATVCPRCGSSLQRIHRRPIDHFLSWILLPQARRYRCEDKECGWTGLRRRGRHRHHPREVEETTQENEAVNPDAPEIQ